MAIQHIKFISPEAEERNIRESAEAVAATFPQHDFDPVTHICRRCLISEEDIYKMRIPRSCMSDAEIASVQRAIRRHF